MATHRDRRREENPERPPRSSEAGSRRWGQVFVTAGRDFLNDNAPIWAAAICYYVLLSFFPLLLAGIVIASYFVDPQWAVGRIQQALGELLPRGEQQIDGVIREVMEARGSVSLISLGILVWSGSRVFGVLTRALNVAYDVEEGYSLWKRLGIEVLWTLGVGVLFILALSSGFLLSLLWSALQILPDERDLVYRAVRWLVPALLLFLCFFLVYRFVPRGRQDTRAAALGAALATLLFLLARPIFAYYVEQFADFNLVYGSIAVVILLLVWTWIVAAIALFGGEIASHYQMIILENRPAAEVEQRHRERSPTQRGRRSEANSTTSLRTG